MVARTCRIFHSHRPRLKHISSGANSLLLPLQTKSGRITTKLKNTSKKNSFLSGPRSQWGTRLTQQNVLNILRASIIFNHNTNTRGSNKKLCSYRAFDIATVFIARCAAQSNSVVVWMSEESGGQVHRTFTPRRYLHNLSGLHRSSNSQQPKCNYQKHVEGGFYGAAHSMYEYLCTRVY